MLSGWFFCVCWATRCWTGAASSILPPHWTKKPTMVTVLRQEPSVSFVCRTSGESLNRYHVWCSQGNLQTIYFLSLSFQSFSMGRGARKKVSTEINLVSQQEANFSVINISHIFLEDLNEQKNIKITLKPIILGSFLLTWCFIIPVIPMHI